MQRALLLVQKGTGFTSPNPAVGAVIVKDGKIIGEGWHKKAGGAHAEILAIEETRNKKQETKRATMYVTLEPCCHTGKTPPCTDAIIAAGIKRVVVGMIDPMRHTNKKGVQELRRRGVMVEVLNPKSILAKEIRELNQPFIKWATTGMPYVVLKAAVSLDGKIATRTGESKWITGLAARQDARIERSICDAVLVGAGTVLADDPELAAHGTYAKKKLLRVIIDPELSLPLSKKVFRDEYVFVACTDRAPSARKRLYEKQEAAFRSFGKTRVSFAHVFQYLGTQNVQSIFVEGGAGIHGALFDETVSNLKSEIINHKLIDEVIFYIAPNIIGGADAVSAVGGEGVKFLDETLSLRDVMWKKIGDDMKISGRVNVY